MALSNVALVLLIIFGYYAADFAIFLVKVWFQRRHEAAEREAFICSLR